MDDTAIVVGLGDALRVLSAQVALYFVLPLWALPLSPRAPSSWLVALLGGLTVQAFLGACTNWTFSHAQHVEPWLYVSSWVLVRVVRGRGRRPANRDTDGLLLMLLLCSVAVRWIHPLQTWALGQSDAYAHLQNMEDVLNSGRLSNAAYPPGFAWLLALPASLFRLDPYEVCRYGGAFHGAGLVLAVYVLGQAWMGRSAARAAAALVAGCPVWTLLAKTGVGCFANQVGLLAMPVAWWSYTQWWTGQDARRSGICLGAALALMAITVPMMLLQTLLALSLAQALAVGCDGWKRAARHVLLLAGLTLPAALLMGVQAQAAGRTARASTVEYVVCTPPPVAPSSTPHGQTGPAPGTGVSGPPPGALRTMASDFLAVKRWGFGDARLNAVAAALMTAFLAAAWMGIARCRPGVALLGVWGLLTSIQSFTGLLQFSNYQREGWSLMVCAALLAGAVAGIVRDRLPVRLLNRLPLWGCVLSALGGLWCPPAHRVFSSPAEDELVRLLRALDGDAQARAAWPDASWLWAAAAPTQEVQFVARIVSGFPDGMGDPVHALRGASRTVLHTVIPPAPGLLLIALLDREGDSSLQAPSLMARLQPGSTALFLRHRQQAEAENAVLARSLADLQRPLQRWSASPRLEVILVR